MTARDAEVVVSGFGPFGDVHLNASGIVAQRMHGALVEGVTVRGVVLPTAFGEARERMVELAADRRTLAVLSLGVWRGAHARIERRAGGVVTSERKDVRGEVWTGRVLGPARATALPLEAWAEALGIPVSEDCGGYVCNATYHALLGTLGEAPRGVFVHVPRDVAGRAIDATEALARRVLGQLLRHLASGPS